MFCRRETPPAIDCCKLVVRKRGARCCRAHRDAPTVEELQKAEEEVGYKLIGTYRATSRHFFFVSACRVPRSGRRISTHPAAACASPRSLFCLLAAWHRLPGPPMETSRTPLPIGCQCLSLDQIAGSQIRQHGRELGVNMEMSCVFSSS